MRVYEPNKDVDLLNDVLKELYLIRMAVDHQSLNVSNIIKMIDNFKFNNRYFLVFEIYGINLYSYLGKFNFYGLKLNIVTSFTNQIINGLK